MITLAIFASGRGSNAKAIIEYLKDHDVIKVGLIVASKKNAGVLELASKFGIASLVLNRKAFYESHEIVRELEQRAISHIVLAGFLWMIPEYLIKAYPDKIVNIHPALLPKYGGKGMYGHHVHQAVYDHKEDHSGMTIHLVNEEYDKGEILFQASCGLEPEDLPDIIAEKVLKLEHHFYPRVVEKWVLEI